MIHRTVVVGPLQCNCVILGCETTREAILIDPGEEADRIAAAVEKAGLTVKYLLHTHAHFDHIGATGALHAKWGAVPCLHRDDEMIYKNLPLQGKMFGFHFGAPPEVGKYLEDGEPIVFGEHKLEVVHTPGHSPGSICFRLDGGEHLFSGDTLFQNSVGRSDLWGGNHDTLIRSIKGRLLTLDDDTQVHPGHGPSTKVGLEKRQNPFLI